MSLEVGVLNPTSLKSLTICGPAFEDFNLIMDDAAVSRSLGRDNCCLLCEDRAECTGRARRTNSANTQLGLWSPEATKRWNFALVRKNVMQTLYPWSLLVFSGETRDC
jgi:hypothetical protein